MKNNIVFLVWFVTKHWTLHLCQVISISSMWQIRMGSIMSHFSDSVLSSQGYVTFKLAQTLINRERTDHFWIPGNKHIHWYSIIAWGVTCKLNKNIAHDIQLPFPLSVREGWGPAVEVKIRSNLIRIYRVFCMSRDGTGGMCYSGRLTCTCRPLYRLVCASGRARK